MFEWAKCSNVNYSNIFKPNVRDLKGFKSLGVTNRWKKLYGSKVKKRNKNFGWTKCSKVNKTKVSKWVKYGREKNTRKERFKSRIIRYTLLHWSTVISVLMRFTGTMPIAHVHANVRRLRVRPLVNRFLILAR